MIENYHLDCMYTGILNADIVLGSNLLSLLKYIDQLQINGMLSERLLMVGRRVNAVTEPQPFNSAQEYESFVMTNYQRQPFYAPMRMVKIK